MRTYKLTIAYDGSRFRGWQRQPDTDLTIQGILEKRITQLVGYEVEVNGSGRTDGGVHARGQTASVILAGKVEDGVLSFLNEGLPEDIRVLRMELMKNGFHARHSARGKCYEYTIDTAPKADVFTRKYTFHYPLEEGRALNLQAMRLAAGYLLGTHDFAGYTDRVDEKSTMRRIDEIEIYCADEMADGGIEWERAKIHIRYKGSGFMYHMVRILTGTLLEVGSGERAPGDVKRALETGKRGDAGFLAPASGLCLMEVYYIRT